MALINLQIQTNDSEVFVGADRLQTVKKLERLLKSASMGARRNALTIVTGVTPVAASGTITMASSSGTVGAVINGVTITVTWATDDTLSSAALAAAINASVNALVSGIVTATSALGVTTITSATKFGVTGNAITLAATGTNVTASGSGRLTGASNGTVTTFTF
jgi:hypothetical protein